MNHTPNRVKWERGDIVIHDADAKQPCMLMRVTGTLGDGTVKTEYVNHISRAMMRQVYTNDRENLHDPRRFGIDPMLVMVGPNNLRPQEG